MRTISGVLVLFFLLVIIGAPSLFAANGTIVWGNSTAAVLATVAYTFPFSIGGPYSAPSATSPAGPITNLKISSAFTRDEKIATYNNALGTLNIYTCKTGCDNEGDWTWRGYYPNATAGISTAGIGNNNSFAVAYEQFQGRAMVIFGNRTQTDTIFYCLWNGSEWSPSSNCGPSTTPWNTSGTGNSVLLGNIGIPVSLQIASRGDEMIVGVAGTNAFGAAVWNGSEWNNSGNITFTSKAVVSMPTYGSAFDVAWENSSGNGLALYDITAGDGITTFSRFNGSTKRWDTINNSNGPSLGADSANWIELSSDPNSSRISAIIGDAAATPDIHLSVWKTNDATPSFTASGTDPIDPSVEPSNGKHTATTWAKNGSLALFLYANLNQNSLDALCWTPSAGFSSVTSNAIGGSGSFASDAEKVVTDRSPDNNESFILTGLNNNNLWGTIWNGTDCSPPKFFNIPTGIIDALSVTVDNHPAIPFGFAYNRFVYPPNEAPRWFSNTTNDSGVIYPNRLLKFNVNWSDTEDLGNHFIAINSSNGFANYSNNLFNGTSNVSEIEIRIVAPGGTDLQWMVYGNDTEAFLNVTTVSTLTIGTLNLSVNATITGATTLTKTENFTINVTVFANCSCFPQNETCSNVNVTILDNSTRELFPSRRAPSYPVYVNTTNYDLGNITGASQNVSFSVNFNEEGHYNVSIMCNSTNGLATNASSLQSQTIIILNPTVPASAGGGSGGSSGGSSSPGKVSPPKKIPPTKAPPPAASAPSAGGTGSSAGGSGSGGSGVAESPIIGRISPMEIVGEKSGENINLIGENLQEKKGRSISEVTVVLENTGPRRMKLFPRVIQEFDDPFFIVTQKTLGYSGSLFHKITSLTYSEQPIYGRLLNAEIIDPRQLTLEPGQQIEQKLQLSEGLASTRSLKIQFTTEDQVAFEKELSPSKQIFVGSAIDPSLEDNALDVYVFMSPIADAERLAQHYQEKEGNILTGAAAIGNVFKNIVPHDEYFVEITILKENNQLLSSPSLISELQNALFGEKVYFDDFYGPYKLSPQQTLIFAQQLKYDPEKYVGNYIIKTKIYNGNRVILRNEFKLILG